MLASSGRALAPCSSDSGWPGSKDVRRLWVDSTRWTHTADRATIRIRITVSPVSADSRRMTGSAKSMSVSAASAAPASAVRRADR